MKWLQGEQLVAYGDNITLSCNEAGRPLAAVATSGFRQCVYDPRPGFPQYWFSGAQPSCPRVDCGRPLDTPGAEYGFLPDTAYKSSFFFGCQPTFILTGQSSKNDNVVRCLDNGAWDFGDLRCEGPVCDDPGRPADGIQISSSYEQGSLIEFQCSRPGYIPITSAPIQVVSFFSFLERFLGDFLGIFEGFLKDFLINSRNMKDF